MTLEADEHVRVSGVAVAVRPLDVSAEVAAVASALAGRAPDLTNELLEVTLAEIPELRGDDAVQQLLAASARENLATGIDVLRHSIEVGRIEPPAAAAEYARRIAQRGVPVEAMLRSYRLGHRTVLRWVSEELCRRELSAAEAIAVLDAVTEASFAYIDRVSEQLIAVYVGERDRWLQSASASRRRTVRAVLSSDAVDLERAEAALRYRLQHLHVGVVVWFDAENRPGDAPAALDRVAAALVAEQPSPPLIVMADEMTLWAWLASDRATPADDEALSAALRVAAPGARAAVGFPAEGVDGFRSTHEDALRAQAVALAAGPRGAVVTSIRDASLVSFLTEDLAAAKRWIERVLGRLADNEDGAARLRQTLRVFLETKGSYTETAARLHLHKSTVHYRIRKAEEARGRSVDHDRIGLEVALLAYEMLGSAVMTDVPTASD